MSTLLRNTARIFALFLLILGATSVHADNDDGNILDRILNRDSANSASSFSGTWDTMVLGGSYRVLKLRQVGNNVNGTYSPGDGKVEGKVNDGVLRVKWKQDGAQGSARFSLSRDGQMMSGMSNRSDDPDAFGQWWNGVRQGKASFAGTWNLTSSDNTNYTVVLQKKGDKISGTFQPGNGVIRDGRVRDGKLSFKYNKEYFEGPAKGEGVFKLSDNGQSLSGNLEEIEGPQKGKATISATRAPASFHGIWSWKEVASDRNIYMKEIHFNQSGDEVNRGGDGGKVIGRTLFFEWDATGLHHNAVLTLAEDGKSFKGVFNFGGDSYKDSKGRNIDTQGVFLRPYSSGK